MYCAVCQSHKSAIVVRSPSRTSTLTLRRDRLCIVELLYVVAAKMYELNLCLCVYDVIFVTQTTTCLKLTAFSLHFNLTHCHWWLICTFCLHNNIKATFQPDRSFFNTVITSCTLAQCASSSFLALTLSTEGSLKLFASPQMCISFGSTGV